MRAAVSAGGAGAVRVSGESGETGGPRAGQTVLPCVQRAARRLGAAAGTPSQRSGRAAASRGGASHHRSRDGG